MFYACCSGDVVVRQGDVGNEMFFIGEGKLEVRIYDDSGDACTAVTGGSSTIYSGPSAGGSLGRAGAGQLPVGSSNKSVSATWMQRMAAKRARRKKVDSELMLNEDLAALPYE